jgi:hypothetical protein
MFKSMKNITFNAIHSQQLSFKRVFLVCYSRPQAQWQKKFKIFSNKNHRLVWSINSQRQYTIKVCDARDLSPLGKTIIWNVLLNIV